MTALPDFTPDPAYLFPPLPAGPFSVILADPPWQFDSWSDKGKDRAPDALVRQKGLAERHYPTVSTDLLAHLPLAQVCTKDCVLFLWVVGSNLEQAFPLAKAWGFTFRTIAFNWVKLTTSEPVRPTLGLGKWTRTNPELCLLFAKGSPRRASASIRALVEAQDFPANLQSPRRKHSQKPPEVHDRINSLLPHGSRLELFARTKREGWTAWGDQLGEPS